jgi:LCP family protein required for cell wall assembly
VAQRRAAGGRPAARRGRRGCNNLLIGLLALLALVILLLVGLSSRARQTLQAIEQADPRRESGSASEPGAGGSRAETAGEQPTPPPPAAFGEPFNVLLVGVDKRPDLEEGVRGDTLILVHVEPGGKWAGMLSIPRDTMVEVPHLGLQKINTAYSYGYMNAAALYGSGTDPAAAGGALVAQTVEQFLNLRVDYIAQVDFHGFELIIDTLGGVLLDVPRPLIDGSYPTEDYGVERIYIPAGLQILDGRTALRYARSRHSGSDFDRSARQQQVLRAMLAEVRRRGLLEQAALAPELARDLEQTVATTLPISDLGVLHALAALAREITPDRIVQLSINPNDVALLREEGSDLYWSPDGVAQQVQRLLAGPAGTLETARVQVQNGAGVQGLAGRVSVQLQQQGFSMAEAGDAPGIYPNTLLIDYTGRPQTLRRLADLLGVEQRYVQSSPPPDAPPAPFQTDIVLVLGADYQERWAAGQ